MKLVPSLILNVLMVSAGILLYDFLSDDAPASGRTSEGPSSESAPVHGFLPNLDEGFDEKALQTLKAYIEEIDRRAEDLRHRSRIADELDSLDLGLDDATRAAVVRETFAYQMRLRDLFGSSRRTEGMERGERFRAIDRLQNEYAAALSRLLEPAATEKILESKVSRAGFHGFKGR